MDRWPLISDVLIQVDLPGAFDSHLALLNESNHFIRLPGGCFVASRFYYSTLSAPALIFSLNQTYCSVIFNHFDVLLDLFNHHTFIFSELNIFLGAFDSQTAVFGVSDLLLGSFDP